MSRFCRIVCMLACGALLLGVPRAVLGAVGERALIFDLTRATPVTLSLSRNDLGPGLADELDTACRKDGTGTPAVVLPKVLCCIDKSDFRWVSHRHDRLNIYIFFNEGETPTLKPPDEKRRNTRLADDIKTLLELAVRIGTRTEALVDKPIVSCLSGTYELTLERATLQVSVVQPKKAAPAGGGEVLGGAAPAAAAKPAEDGKSVDVTLTTGPKEHLFLAADLPVRRINELKFDSATSSLAPATTPTQFYISGNYAFGDLLGSPEHRGFLDNLALKVMVKGSKTPAESFGVGLSLRGSYVINLDTVSPFVGYIWTRSDPAAPAGTAGEGLTRTMQFGASFNLTQALAWLKGS